jgi:hypothetical protein
MVCLASKQKNRDFKNSCGCIDITSGVGVIIIKKDMDL